MQNKIIIMVSVLAMLMQTQCATSSGDNYSGPGSFYNVVLSDVAFSMEISSGVGQQVQNGFSGDAEILDTGFLKLTVGNIEKSGSGGPAHGDKAYGLLIDGMALFLKPLNSAEVVPTVLTGKCPDDDFTANWVMGQQEGDKDFLSDVQEAFGVFEFSRSAETATVATGFNLMDYTNILAEEKVLDAVDCNKGFMQLTEDDGLSNVWLTRNGGAIVETLVETDAGMQRNSTIVALPTVELTGLKQIGGDYAGLVFTEDDGGAVQPVQVTFSNAGVGTVALLADVETGEVADDALAAITLTGEINSPSDGFITGVVEVDEASGNLVCSVLPNAAETGKTVAVCIGQAPDDPSNQFLLVMVEK